MRNSLIATKFTFGIALIALTLVACGPTVTFQRPHFPDTLRSMAARNSPPRIAVLVPYVKSFEEGSAGQVDENSAESTAASNALGAALVRALQRRGMSSELISMREEYEEHLALFSSIFTAAIFAKMPNSPFPIPAIGDNLEFTLGTSLASVGATLPSQSFKPDMYLLTVGKNVEPTSGAVAMRILHVLTLGLAGHGKTSMLSSPICIGLFDAKSGDLLWLAFSASNDSYSFVGVSPEALDGTVQWLFTEFPALH